MASTEEGIADSCIPSCRYCPQERTEDIRDILILTSAKSGELAVRCGGYGRWETCRPAKEGDK